MAWEIEKRKIENEFCGSHFFFKKYSTQLNLLIKSKSLTLPIQLQQSWLKKFVVWTNVFIFEILLLFWSFIYLYTFISHQENLITHSILYWLIYWPFSYRSLKTLLTHFFGLAHELLSKSLYHSASRGFFWNNFIAFVVFISCSVYNTTGVSLQAKFI